MAEEVQEPNVPAEEKKWSEWTVVSMNDGSLRCKRVDLADEKNVEYRQVPNPSFTVDELTAIAEFCKSGLLESQAVANTVHSRRYLDVAFRMRDTLNAPVPSVGK